MYRVALMIWALVIVSFAIWLLANYDIITFGYVIGLAVFSFAAGWWARFFVAMEE
jgi:hypothetical protein